MRYVTAPSIEADVRTVGPDRSGGETRAAFASNQRGIVWQYQSGVGSLALPRNGDGDSLTTHADADYGSRRGSAKHAVRQKQQSLRRAREGDEHPLLGRLQLRPGSRSLPQERGCDGEGREPDQRSDHDKSAARRRDQCLGLDQRQQSLGAQSDVASKADQAAAARSVRALFREYAPGRQGAL